MAMFCPSSDWTEEERKKASLQIIGKMRDCLRGSSSLQRGELHDYLNRLGFLIEEGESFLEANRGNILGP